MSGPIDVVALSGFLSQAARSDVVVSALARLQGGAIQENWSLDLRIAGGPHAGQHSLVLRTDAPSAVQESRPRSQEFALLKAAHAAGVTVPEPLFLCTDPAVIGKPFYIMRRATGTAAGHVLTRGEERPALTRRLGTELARIHRIRPPRADLDFLTLPARSPALDAIAKYRDFLDTHRAPHPTVEYGLRWLEQRAEELAPPTAPLVLCHHDFRTGNYMVDDAAPGPDGSGLTAVLDWEFADWSDPMEDVAWFCARCWRFGAPDREAGGIGSRADFYRGYVQGGGFPVEPGAIRFWEVMAHVRWAVIALQQAERHIGGGERSLDLALTGRRPAELELEILILTAEDDWREEARHA